MLVYHYEPCERSPSALVVLVVLLVLVRYRDGGIEENDVEDVDVDVEEDVEEERYGQGL